MTQSQPLNRAMATLLGVVVAGVVLGIVDTFLQPPVLVLLAGALLVLAGSLWSIWRDPSLDSRSRKALTLLAALAFAAFFSGALSSAFQIGIMRGVLIAIYFGMTGLTLALGYYVKLARLNSQPIDQAEE